MIYSLENIRAYYEGEDPKRFIVESPEVNGKNVVVVIEVLSTSPSYPKIRITLFDKETFNPLTGENYLDASFNLIKKYYSIQELEVDELNRKNGYGFQLMNSLFLYANKLEKEHNIRFTQIEGTLSEKDKPDNWKLSIPFYINLINRVNKDNKHIYYQRLSIELKDNLGKTYSPEDFFDKLNRGKFYYYIAP